MNKKRVTRRPIMQRCFSGLIAAAAVLAGYHPALAEDIDLFVQPPGLATGAPMS